MKRRIIFCSHWVDRYRPLIRELLQSGAYEVYAEENFVRKFGERHPSLQPYMTFFPRPDWAAIQVETERRLAAMTDFLTRSARRYVSDCEHFPSLSRTDHLSAALRESLAQVIYMKQTFDAFAQKLQPDLLIVDGPGIRQQTWVSAAKRHGIPSLEIYHGTIHVKPDLIPRRHDQADYMAMDSDLVRDIYRELGIPPDRLRVTGLPEEPVKPPPKEEAVRILAEKYGLDPQKKTALLFTAYDVGNSMEFLFEFSTGYQVEIVRQAAAAVKAVDGRVPGGVQLLIKRHPTLAAAGWDDLEAYRYVTGREGISPVMVDPKASNPLLLAAADAVLVVKFSSTISEALNADRPVLMWPHLRDWLHDDLLHSGAIIFTDDETALREALEKCLVDGAFNEKIAHNRRTYLEKYRHVPVDEVIGNLLQFIDDVITAERDEKQRIRPFEERVHTLATAGLGT